LFEDRPEHSMARMAEENPYRAILFGHTHVPYAREVPHGGAGASTLFVNVGSGGRPKDGDWRVCYAVVDPAALAVGAPAVEFARVPYDYARLQQALARTDLITAFEAPSEWSAG
jgi:diadenosine tetraphosphatase ApaH/serine/threonine PP2A family protein phosphatase